MNGKRRLVDIGGFVYYPYYPYYPLHLFDSPDSALDREHIFIKSRIFLTIAQRKDAELRRKEASTWKDFME
jgi:hypothetical protein